jgi:transcriptional regulator with XRE-family HTH domain
VSAQAKVKKLKDKAYRRAYMQGHVRSGIAYQIRALREQRGLSQKAFAELVGTKQSVISRLESTEYGKVSVQTLLDIATAIDVALNIRFCSYPEFLNRTADVSVDALKVPSFEDSNWDKETAEPTSIIVPDGTVATQAQVITQFHPIAFVQNATGVGLWLMISFNTSRTPDAQGLLNTGTFIPTSVTSESALLT